MAERIKLSRKKGWRMPENTVKVDRTSKWGNPYAIAGGKREHWRVEAGKLVLGRFCNVAAALECSLNAFSTALRTQAGCVEVTVEDVRRELAGKNLACWCKPGAPCHADVLLRVAAGGDP